MILSDNEVARIRGLLLEIDRADKAGAKKNYIQNQTRNIRLMLIRAERRAKNTLL